MTNIILIIVGVVVLAGGLFLVLRGLKSNDEDDLVDTPVSGPSLHGPQ